MVSKKVVVNKRIGLYARPATVFVQMANRFKSTILIEMENKEVNAKSLLGVLSLGILNGSEVNIVADGEDEQAAADELGNFLETDV